MKKIILLLVLLIAAAAAAALLYFTLGKPAPKAADLLPETTLLFLDVPDFARSREQFRKTALYGLWHEPELQAFLEKPRQILRERLHGQAGKDENDLAALILNAMQGEVFLAITQFALLPTFQPGVVIGMDVKRKRIEASAGLYRLQSRLKSAYPEGRFESKNYLGVKYSIWELRPNMPVCHAFLNSMLVFTYGEEGMRDLISRFTGHAADDAPALSASAPYRAVLERAPKEHEFHAYINTEQLAALLGPLIMMSPQSAGMFQKLGRIRATGNSITFVERAVQDVGHIAYKANGPKPTAPTRRDTLALTAPDTMLYSVGSADLAASYDEIMLALTQTGHPRLASGATRFEQTVRARGVRIREDLLANLGPETAVMATWPAGTRFPQLAIVAQIHNAAKARPALDVTLSVLKNQLLGGDEEFPWEETHSDGQTWRTVRIGAGAVAPTYWTTERFFILASTPDYARELFAQLKDGKPTLASSPGYQQSMNQLPPNGSSYTYCDMRSLFVPLYDLTKSRLSGPGTNALVQADKWPRAETIAKHLFPFVSATVADQQTETTTSFSPLGRPVMFLAGAVGGFLAAQALAPAPPPAFIPTEPKTSSDTGAVRPPDGNQTAPSQTPSPQ